MSTKNSKGASKANANDRPLFLLVARGMNRRCNRLQIDQICGRMMPEVRR